MSNSNAVERLPQLPFLKIWLFTGLTILLFLTGWNIFWTSRGEQVSFYDNAELWMYHRRRVSLWNEKAVVLVGSSAIHMGIDQKVLAAQSGLEPIQLATGGASPLPLLRDLAEDESFRGLVIADFLELIVYIRETKGPTLQLLLENVPIQIEDWQKGFKNRKISDDVEFGLRARVRNVILSPSILSVSDNSRTAQLQFNRGYPEGHQLPAEQIEFMQAKYQEFATNQMEKDPPRPEKFIKIVQELEGYVKRIQARGGKVILIATPRTGNGWEWIEKMFPKKEYWDVLAANTSAETIHSKDYTVFDNIICPDGIHLDGKRASEYTEKLAKIIFEKK